MPHHCKLASVILQWRLCLLHHLFTVWQLLPCTWHKTLNNDLPHSGLTQCSNTSYQFAFISQNNTRQLICLWNLKDILAFWKKLVNSFAMTWHIYAYPQLFHDLCSYLYHWNNGLYFTPDNCHKHVCTYIFARSLVQPSAECYQHLPTAAVCATQRSSR